MTTVQCACSNVLGPRAPEQRCAACPFREAARPPCLHPHVENVDAHTAKCATCPQRFGLCKRHGVYPLDLDRGSRCPKCEASK